MKKKSKGYHHGNLRPSLIQAGLEILAEGGLHALSLREMARRIGVSHTAPYRHFPDKESVLAAIAEEGLRMLNESIDEVLRAHPDAPRLQLRACSSAYLRFALQHPQHFRTMFESFGAPGSDTQDVRRKFPHLCELGDHTFGRIISLIKACQAQPKSGFAKGEDPRLVALSFWSLTHGFTVLVLSKNIEPECTGIQLPPEKLCLKISKLIYDSLEN